MKLRTRIKAINHNHADAVASLGRRIRDEFPDATPIGVVTVAERISNGRSWVATVVVEEETDFLTPQGAT